MSGFAVPTPYFDFYFYYAPLLILFPFFLYKYKAAAPSGFFLFIFINIFIGLIGILTENNTMILFGKQIVAISIFYLFYYYIIKLSDYNISYLFKIYINLSFIVSIIGLFQVLSYLLNFNHGYDFSYIIPRWKLSFTEFGIIRLNSVLQEPSHYSLCLAPAFYASFSNLINKQKRLFSIFYSLVIILAYLLTFSSIAFIGAFLSVFYYFYQLKNPIFKILSPILVAPLLYFTWKHFSDFHLRAYDIYQAIAYKDFDNANLSSFTLYNNYHIALSNFRSNFLFGNGLGSHAIAFDKFTLSAPHDILLNKEDANSLALRIISELGLFGIVSISYFIFKNRLKTSFHNLQDLNIINACFFLGILLNLVRGGNYITNGLPFFFLMFYFSHKLVKPALKY
jgi:hypothetical protein